MTFLAYVDGSRYAISDDDADPFERAVVSALRSGGDFVDVPNRPHSTVRILVTPASTIRLERLPDADDASEGGDDGEEFFDFAFYDFEP